MKTLNQIIQGKALPPLLSNLRISDRTMTVGQQQKNGNTAPSQKVSCLYSTCSSHSPISVLASSSTLFPVVTPLYSKLSYASSTDEYSSTRSYPSRSVLQQFDATI